MRLQPERTPTYDIEVRIAAEGEATCPGQHLGTGAPIGRELEGLPHAYSVSSQRSR